MSERTDGRSTDGPKNTETPQRSINRKDEDVRIRVPLLQQILDVRGISNYALSQMTGLTQGFLSKLMNGQIKNPEKTGIGTAKRIANAIDLPLGGLIEPSDRWHHVAMMDEDDYFRFLTTFARCECLLSASETADSFLLPDDYSYRVEVERLDREPISDRLRREVLIRHRRTMTVRRTSREEGSHFQQITAPVYYWRERTAATTADLEGMKRNAEQFADRCAIGFVDDGTWASTVEQLEQAIPFWGWYKINVADRMMVAVWYHFEVFFTTDEAIVSRVRDILEDAGGTVGMPRYAGRHRSPVNDALRASRRQTLQTIDDVLRLRDGERNSVPRKPR